MDTNINCCDKSIKCRFSVDLKSVKRRPLRSIHSCRSVHHTPTQEASAQAPSWLAERASSASTLRRLTIPRCSHELVEQSSHLSLGRHCCGSPQSIADQQTKNNPKVLFILARLLDYLFVQASPLAVFITEMTTQLHV